VRLGVLKKGFQKLGFETRKGVVVSPRGIQSTETALKKGDIRNEDFCTTGSHRAHHLIRKRNLYWLVSDHDNHLWSRCLCRLRELQQLD